MIVALLLFAGCFVESTPCDDYCSYICDCHAGEEGYDCQDCYASYEGAEAAVQDECETALIDLRAEDELNGTGCVEGIDTGAR